MNAPAILRHPDRAHLIWPRPSLADIAAWICQGPWTLCSAFSCDDVVIVNDADEVSTLQRWTILRGARPVSSFTVRTGDVAGLTRHLERQAIARPAEPPCDFAALSNHPRRTKCPNCEWPPD